jgi:uncharacterized membrane protein YhaH (DUF805 family)
MPSLIDLFFTFNGRISRKAFWVGSLLLAAVSITGTLLIDPNIFDIDLVNLASPTPNWADIVWQLALVVPGMALMVKRFNDRDRPYWLGYAFGAAGAGLTIAPKFGLLIPGDTGSVGTIVLVFIGLAFFFASIDTGLLHGTHGPNRYGPDPLAPNGTHAP